MYSSFLVNGRMPTCRYPRASDKNRHHMIELQCEHGGAPADCSPNDSRPLRAPGKMSRPLLTARIEQSHSSPCDWVSCVGLCSLEPITHPTRKPKVVFSIRTAVCLWDEVIDFQWSEYVLLGTEAISASFLRLFTDAGTDSLGNVPAIHGVKGSRSPRRTAS